jgi:hypothetical protein
VWQEQFVEKIRQILDNDPGIIALFLAGSFGKGQADAYSDIDLLAVVTPDSYSDFNNVWRQYLQAIAPIVFWNEFGNDQRIINAITEQWQRIDLVLIDEEALRKRAKDSVRPLIDRYSLYETLPTIIPWSGPNKRYITHLINEFFRVFGLLAVAAGRGEYLLSVAGVDLLRMMLFNLLSEEVEVADKGGMLAWSRRLSEEQLGLLATIPPAAPTRQSIIDAHLACANAFLPRARRMAAKWEIEPQAFEEATWNHLEREVGLSRPTA